MGDKPPAGFDPIIADYYERAPEETRLAQGPFQLENLRTRELIQRFAPSPPATVVDIGGAAGAYALWLAEAGYTVHLLDPVPRLVDGGAAPQRQCRAPAGLLPHRRCPLARPRTRYRGRRPPAWPAVPPDRGRGARKCAAGGNPHPQAGRQAVRRRHLPVCLGVGRARARPAAGSPLRADRGARSPGGPTSQSDRAAGLLHHGLLSSPG